MGLSSVRLEKVEFHSQLGPVLHVAGADLMNGTPIFDIKPYLPSADSHREARGGFTDRIQDHRLEVKFPEEFLEKIDKERRQALIEVLENDPRPGYQEDPERIYGISYGKNNIKFRVKENILTVVNVMEYKKV